MSSLLTSYVCVALVLVVLVKCVNSFVLEAPMLDARDAGSAVQSHTANETGADFLPKVNEIFDLLTDMDNETETDADNGWFGCGRLISMQIHHFFTSISNKINYLDSSNPRNDNYYVQLVWPISFAFRWLVC